MGRQRHTRTQQTKVTEVDGRHAERLGELVECLAASDVLELVAALEKAGYTSLDDDRETLARLLEKSRRRWFEPADCDAVVALMRNPLADIGQFLFHIENLVGDPGLSEANEPASRILDLIEDKTEAEVAALFAA